MVSKIPPTTMGILGLCTTIYLVQWITDPYVHHYTMCPRAVLYLHEYHRILTSCVFHGGMGHLVTNMASTFVLSTSLEHSRGTFVHLISTLWAMILTSLVYICIAWTMNIILDHSSLMYQHSLGFSGVLFHMCVLEVNASSSTNTRSVFGLMNVPSYLYPIALLIILQLFMPQISFVGHLSGIITGTLELYGVYHDVCLPSNDYLQSLEQQSQQFVFIKWIIKHPNFVKTPTMNADYATHSNDGILLGSSSSTRHPQRRTPRMLLRAIWNGIVLLWKLIKDTLETLKVCLFGYGTTATTTTTTTTNANSNNTIASSWMTFSWSQNNTTTNTSRPELGTGHVLGGVGHSNNNNTILDDEDDDWVGLPVLSSQEEQQEQDRRDTESQLL